LPGLVYYALSGLYLFYLTQGVALGWYVTPFQGFTFFYLTQGVALGWYVTPFQGFIIVVIYSRVLPWADILRPFRALPIFYI